MSVIKNKKKKLKSYFLYTFILTCTLTPLVLVYNSCGESKLSKISSENPPIDDSNLPVRPIGQGLVTPPPPGHNAILKTEEHTVSEESLNNAIDFLFVVEISTETIDTEYRDKIDEFLEFITDSSNINARIAIARLSSIENPSSPIAPGFETQFLYPFSGNQNYVTSSHTLNAQNNLERAFDNVSNPDLIPRRPATLPIETVLITPKTQAFIQARPSTPLEVIVISSNDISGNTVLQISNAITSPLNLPSNFRINAITTTKNPTTETPSCGDQSKADTLIGVAKKISRERSDFTAVTFDICSEKANYTTHFGAILQSHGITYPNNTNVIPPTRFILEEIPDLIQGIQISIQKEQSDGTTSWEILPNLNNSIQVNDEDGNVLSVYDAADNPLAPGKYKIKYYYYERTN